MKANISSTIKAHLIRSALYLLLLLALWVSSFALGQRASARQNTSANTAQPPITSAENERHPGALPTPEIPTGVYSQYNNPATKPPLGIGSQKFEPAMAAFDDQAADDFVLTVPPPPIYLYLTGVRVMGEYSTGGGPASSFNVYIYANGPGNLPGMGVASFLNRPYTGTPPDFTINWTPMQFSFPSGTYWVSVQAVQNFNTNGQWFWHDRTVQSNSGAAWQNPGDGYGTGCITWNRKNACMADQVSPDQVFEILGFYEGPTPTATATPTATPTVTPGVTPTPSDCPGGGCSPSPTPTPTASPSPIACALFEQFDNVTPPALPPGWIATNAINPDGILWQTSNSGLPSPPADSPPNAVWVNDPATVSDKLLDSPPVSVPLLQNSILTFRHNYEFENGFDGGVLEISIDGGPFQDAAVFILQGGYNGVISTCCGNPLAGRQAWTGSSGGFIATSVALPSGHTAVLRWRMGSDNGGSGQGWRIDTAQGFCEGPTPTSTPTVTATPTPTPPSPTATATVTPTITPPSPSPSPTLIDTPTPTPTHTPPVRVTSTPRPRPNPPPRP